MFFVLNKVGRIWSGAYLPPSALGRETSTDYLTTHIRTPDNAHARFLRANYGSISFFGIYIKAKATDAVALIIVKMSRDDAWRWVAAHSPLWRYPSFVRNSVSIEPITVHNSTTHCLVLRALNKPLIYISRDIYSSHNIKSP
jgi:hypothetical protein